MTTKTKAETDAERLQDAIAMLNTTQAYLAKRLPSSTYTMLHRDFVCLRAKLMNLSRESPDGKAKT